MLSAAFLSLIIIISTNFWGLLVLHDPIEEPLKNEACLMGLEYPCGNDPNSSCLTISLVFIKKTKSFTAVARASGLQMYEVMTWRTSTLAWYCWFEKSGEEDWEGKTVSLEMWKEEVTLKRKDGARHKTILSWKTFQDGAFTEKGRIYEIHLGDITAIRKTTFRVGEYRETES